VAWAVWRDTEVDWGSFDAVVIHSTWDYHQARAEFVRWAQHVDSVTSLFNPAPIVAWNSHKGYLLDLEQWTVPTIPTVVVSQSVPESVASIADREGWSEVVIKPSIGAGALGASRWRADDPAGERALAKVLESNDALVQPFLREIEHAGETSLVVFGDVVSHAVAKRPATGDFRVQLHHGGTAHAVTPTAAELDVALHAVKAARNVAPVLYARVDCVTVHGQPCVMELEVIEPSLFLDLAPPNAAGHLMAAVLASL
jgi:glutathione synthase/RimK-type ligase-like ATP-grasp enzyme